MDTFTLTALAAAIAYSACALAFDGISRSEYYKAQDRNEAAYKSEKAGCEARSAHAKEICLAQARGSNMAARAELQAAYNPTTRTRYEALLAKAEGDYWTAKAKCEDRKGSDRDLCVGSAEAARIAAKGEARAKLVAAEAVKAPD